MLDNEYSKMKYPNLNEEKKLWKRGFKIVVGLDEAGRGCEKIDAEVLTSNGWKFYADIGPKDKVLSYTDNGYLEWQNINKVIEKNFEGGLIELKNKGIKMIVTPDHCFNVLRRVFVRDKKDNNRLKLIGYKLREERKKATNLSNNDFIPRGGRWRGKNARFFKLPETDKTGKKFIDIELWVAFLGIFLSEGSTTYDKNKGSYKIVISQHEKSPHYEKIYSLLKKLPFRFSKYREGFQCCNKQLHTYLKQFGNRYNKFIPKDIKETSLQLLNALIEWMIRGDGSCYTGKNRKKVCVYYTVSERLKDDFEEILLKAGWTYHTSARAPKDRYIKDRLIKKENQTSCFEIRLRRNNKAHIKALHKKEIFYKGKVFCLQLPKYHNFYIRRDGTGYFTGNSLAGPVAAAAVMINSKFKRQKSKIQVKNQKLLRGVKDSKKLNAKKREEIYKILITHSAIEWGIGVVSEKIIDKINIKNAAERAMQISLEKLEKKIGKKTNFLLIDGNNIKNRELKSRNHKLIVGADEKVFSCAAASILAKVWRDRIMYRQHKKYPEYGFDEHKGYPTKSHREKVSVFGPCVIHRRSFLTKRSVVE